MGSHIAFQTRDLADVPSVRAYGNGRDSGWLEVCDVPAQDTPLGWLAAAAEEHPEIGELVDEALALGGWLQLDGQPLDPLALAQAVPAHRQAQHAVLREQHLDETLPTSPPRPPPARM